MRLSVNFANLEPVLLLGGAVLVERQATISITEAGDDAKETWRIQVVYDDKLERLVASSVTVERGGTGKEVTARKLRDVRVQESIRAATSHLVKLRVAGTRSYIPATADKLERFRNRDWDSRGHMVGAALVLHTLARVANMPSVKFAADHLGVSVSTAARLLAEAVEDPDLTRMGLE